MKLRIFAGLMVLGGVAVGRAGDAPNTTLVDSGPIKILLKGLPSDKGDFGIDWQANFKKTLQNGAKPGDPRDLSLGFQSKGFVALKEAENPHDSVTAKLNVEGGAWKPFAPPPSPPSGSAPSLDVSIGDLSKQAAGGPTWYIFPAVDAVFESTQTIRHFNTGIGVSVAINTSFANRFLDIIPSLMRYGPNAATNNPRMIDVALGYHYVRQQFVSALFPNQENISRGDVNVEWETGIFSEQRLVFHYNGYYLPATATRRYVDFFAVRLDLLKFPAGLSKGAVSLKYTTGELPPLYKTGTSLGGGLSIDF